ncbi:hypothetical protein GPL17_33785 [Bradyrhizobium yuanmingense]|nr:hypothetical protein [Bradyrhizobium yuanmingense]
MRRARHRERRQGRPARQDRGADGGDRTGGSVARALSPSSLRAQRSNPDFYRGGSLDCFVAKAPRNDGGDVS